MLQRVLDLCADAELAPVIVVLGADADQIESTMSWRSELRVHNPSPERGLAQSVRLGMWTLLRLQQVDRAAVLLGDQPFLTLQQLGTIVGARGQIVVPRYDGKPGNPVVLDRSVWTLAAGLDGDRGFSQLFSAYPNLVSFVDVAGSNPDIDTPDDLVTGYFG